MGWLRAQRPDLVDRYEELYRRGAYAPREERERLSRMARRGGSPGGGFFRRGSLPPRQDAADAEHSERQPADHQERLF